MDVRFLFLIAFLGGMGCGTTLAEDTDLCGQRNSDPTKTCISVRLPWNPQPIYFCTEKEDLIYERNCFGRSRCHDSTSWTKKALLIATPWDCCPISSIPSRCEDTICAPMPLNRTCVTLEQDHSQRCCPVYFCEEDAIAQKTCNFKILEESCHSPPPSKKNCIGFVDHFGCCTKYQCEGEGKPGKCPAFPPIRMDPFPSVLGHDGSRPRRRSRNDAGRALRTPRESEMLHTGALEGLTSCVGDWTCPNDMKCCPTNEIREGVHLKYSHRKKGNHYNFPPKIAMPGDGFDGDSNDVFYDSAAVYGYCASPLKETKKETTIASVNEEPVPTAK